MAGFTLTLDQAVLERHSTRRFLSTPVPPGIFADSLELARHAPSNSNIQPWRLFCAVDAARDRLRDALLVAASQGEPSIPPLPPAFEHYRRELGAVVYGAMQIGPHDAALHKAAVLRNYDFFGAPLVAIVCMPAVLGLADAMSVGMYVQTLVLATTAQGLGSCVEVSVAGYPDVLRRELSIPSDLTILCGMAVGYADPAFAANKIHVSRDPIEATVVFHST